MIDRKRVAEAIYRSRHTEWRGFIPRSIELQYGRMADAAIAEVGFQMSCQAAQRSGS